MGCTIATPDARPDHSAVPCLALRPKAICALDPASELPASASGTGKVRGDRASPTDTAADEVLMRDSPQHDMSHNPWQEVSRGA